MADVVSIKIKADATQAKREMKGLGGSFDNLAGKAASSGAALAAVTAGVLALGAAVVSTGAALVQNAADVALLGDEIAKTARIVGVSAEQFQVLRFAAERSGVSMSSVTNGLKRLSKSLFDAQNGSKQIKDTFIGMGIAIEDVDGNLRDSEDVFRDIADRIKAVGINTQTTAELLTVGGRSFADLTNILIGGSEALDDFERQAKSLGGIMDGQLLASSEAYQDAIADMDLATQGLKNELAVGLIPTLTFLSDIMSQRVTPNVRRMVSELGAFKLPAGLKALLRVLPGGTLVDAVSVLSTAAVGLGATQSAPFDPQAEAEGLFLAATASAANGKPGGGKKTEPTAENFPGVFNLVEATQEAQRLTTQAAIEGMADRLFWERDALAMSKALKDQAAAEDAARHEEAIRQAQDLANAQTQAASSAFGSIETFAGMAQSAVEDSYFGQTKAGRAAAKALFVAGKAAALANAIVNTAQAVTNALAVQPYPLGAALAVSAGIAGGTQIGTIVGTTIQGIADAGLAPGALRSAGLNQHTAIAVGPDETVIDPRGTADISRMLNLQRRQMEMAAQGGANGGPTIVVAELDGRRVSRALSGPMTADLEDGHDFRRNVRMGVA